MSEPLTIADLRAELGLTLAEMGEKCGISKSQMHDAEQRQRASLPVALKIEQLSIRDGAPRIDAAELNDEVRAARAAVSEQVA